jgi:hypothetical protein
MKRNKKNKNEMKRNKNHKKHFFYDSPREQSI